MATGPATVRLSRLSETEAPEAQIPSTIGSVRLVKQVGKGGMGVVWLAHHEILGRDVAVKFVLSAACRSPSQSPPALSSDPSGSSPEAGPASPPPAPAEPSGAGQADELQAFIEGCRAAAAVRHIGLVEVYHADLVNGIPYLVMEYVDGPSLEAVVRRLGALSTPLSLAIMEVTCAAIAELHDAGIIHRDIKPANLLLSPEGHIEVTDFGLACERPGGKGQERVGLAGTPVYMAPEMFEGQISLKSDVYAIGMTLFELLTGTVPFDGSPTVVHARHRDDPLPTEMLSVYKVPPEVVEVIERATCKNPMLRSRTARHVLQALKNAVRDEDVWDQGRRELAQLTSLWRSTPEDEDAEAAPSSATYYEHISMRAARKRRSTPVAVQTPSGEAPIPVRAEPEKVREHVPCAGCGADLFSRPLQEPCPECATAISASLAPERLCFADRAWLGAMRSGLGAFLLWVLAIVPIWLVIGATAYAMLRSRADATSGLWDRPDARSLPWFAAAWLIAAWAGLAYAFLRATPAEGAGSQPRRAPNIARVAARACAFAAFAAGAASNMLYLGSVRASARAAFSLEFALATAALGVLVWWLSRVVRSIPAPRAATAGSLVGASCALASFMWVLWACLDPAEEWSSRRIFLAVLVGLTTSLSVGAGLSYVWRARMMLVFQIDPSLRPKPRPPEEE